MTSLSMLLCSPEKSDSWAGLCHDDSLRLTVDDHHEVTAVAVYACGVDDVCVPCLALRCARVLCNGCCLLG